MVNVGDLLAVLKLQDEMSPLLGVAGKNISEFTDAANKAFPEVAVAIGVVTVALGAAVGAVVALGEEGSKILGVSNAFDRLADSAGSTGDTFRDALSNGVKGTVSEMTLMQDTVKLLSAGVKLGADDLTLMGEASRAMGKATGTDAAQGLEIMSQALLTGRTRGLAAAGIVVDLKAAERDYAEALGVTADQLSVAGKKDADRHAILLATQGYVDRMGVSELTFAERIKQGEVAVEEWGASLAKSVASSPQVMQALQTISSAVTQAFDADKQSLLDATTHGINSFATGVADAVPYVVSFVNGVGTTFDALSRYRITVEAVVGALILYNSTAMLSALATSSLMFPFALLIDQIAAFGLSVGISTSVEYLWAIATASVTTTFQTLWATLAANPLVAVAAAVAVLTLALTQWYAASKDAALAAEELGAKQDVIHRAIAEGAPKTITYADAILYTAEAARQASGRAQDLATSLKNLQGNSGNTQTELKELNLSVLDLANKGQLTTPLVNQVGAALKAMHVPATELSAALLNIANATGVYDKASTDSLINTEKASVAMQKKITDMVATMDGAGKSTHVIEGAFNQLTDAQRSNLAVGEQLLPELDKLVKAHVVLSPAMLDVYTRTVLARTAYADYEAGLLATKGVTLEYIDAQKASGVSEQELATMQGVTVDGLKVYTAQLQLTSDMHKETKALAIEHDKAWAAEEIKNAQTVNKAVVDGFNQTRVATLDYYNFMMQSSLTARDFEILKIQEWQTAQINGFRGTEQQRALFNANIAAMAKAQTDALFIDNNALRDNSKETLQQTADKAYATYMAMEANSDDYSSKTIRHYREIAESAQACADGEMTSQQKVQTGLSDVSQILSVIPGQFAKVANEAISAANDMMKAYESGGGGLSGAINAAVAGLVDLGKALVNIGGPSADELAARSGFTQFESSIKSSSLPQTLEIMTAAYQKLGLTGAEAASDLQRALDMTHVSAAAEASMLQVINDKMAAAAAQAATLKTASDGLTTGLGISSTALATYDQLNAKQLAGAAAGAKMNEVTLNGKTYLSALTQAEFEQMNTAGQLFDATKVHSQEAAQGLAASITGVVAANMKAGQSFIDAVRGAGPAVTALQAQLVATGYSGGAAFDFIKKEVALANDAVAGPALKSLEGYTAGMKGLSDAGILNQETFAGLANQIAGTGAALIGQGKDSSSVMLAMRGDLQTIWEMQQKYGYTVDDSTQKMINQGLQSGLIGEKQKDVNNQILDVLMAIGKALGATLPDDMKTFGKAGVDAADHITDAMNNIPRNIDTKVTITSVASDAASASAAAPSVNAASHAVGETAARLDQWYALPFDYRINTTFDAWDAANPQADGGDYLVTKPTLFLAGEVPGSSERVSFSGATKQDMNQPQGGALSDDAALSIVGALNRQTNELKLAFKQAAIMA